MAVTQRPLSNGRIVDRERIRQHDDRDDLRRALGDEPPRRPARQSDYRKPFQARKIRQQNNQALSAIGFLILVLSHVGGALTLAGPSSLDFKAGIAIGSETPLLQWSIMGLNIWLAAIGVGLQYGVTRIEWHNISNKGCSHLGEEGTTTRHADR